MGIIHPNNQVRHVVCAGALSRVKADHRVVPLNSLSEASSTCIGWCI